MSEPDRNLGVLAPHDHAVFETATGRTIHLWLHECDSCVSLDVWTDRGRDVETVSANTGDTSKAPIGLMAWRRGSTFGLEEIEAPEQPVAVNRVPVAAVVLLWNDNAEG